MRLKNQMEGHFNRMQSGLCLLTDGADRLRLQDWETVEALTLLANLRMNALSLAAERHHEGCAPAQLPDAPLGPLPVENAGGSKRVRMRPAVTAGPSAVEAPGSPATRRGRAAPLAAPGRTAVASALPPSASLTQADPSRVRDEPPELPTVPSTANASNVIVVDFKARRRERA